MTIAWIFYNSFSNLEKLKSFQKSKYTKKIAVKFVETNELFLLNTDSGEEILVEAKNGNQVTLPDFVVSLIPDEKYDRVGYKILEYLEKNKVKPLNSIKSVRLATDKYEASVLLSKNGFRVPKTILFARGTNIKNIIFPCVIKPIDGRKSRGVRILKSRIQFEEYLDKITDELFIIQDFISSSYRKDIRTFVFNGKFLGAVHRTARKNTFGSIVSKSIEISKEQQKKAVMVAQLFGLVFCSVDFFVDENQTICEVNANPGFKVLNQFVTKDITQYIYSYFENNHLV